ncbi:MAG: hypothetical protein ACJAZO_002806 [Myxococcota bacterium]|jgi:hypothetical protein
MAGADRRVAFGAGAGRVGEVDRSCDTVSLVVVSAKG